VNIWREVRADGAGIVAPDTVEGTAHALAQWFRMDRAAADAMRAQALVTFRQRFHVDAMSRDLLRVIRGIARDRNGVFGKEPLSAPVEQ